MSIGSPTEPVDRALRRLRPMVASGLLLYVVVRAGGSPDGRESLLAIVACSLALLTIGRVTARVRGSGARAEQVADAVTVGLDAFVTVLAITRMDLLDPELGWALLLIPVLEGALRFRMRGVVVVWCAVTAMYVGLELRVPADLTDPLTQAAFLEQIQTLVYRSGIVLLVAVPGGYLSDQLLRAIGSQRLVQLAAAERNSVLVGVVDAGRSIGRSGIDLPAAVVEAALDLGFDEAEWLTYDSRSGWTVRGRSGGTAPDLETGLDHGERFGALVSAVATTGSTMRAGRDDPDPMVPAELDVAGLEEVVAAPVRSRSDTIAVLRVATRAGIRPSEQQIEGLELLAAQAGVAGENAQLLTDLDAARADLEHQATHDGLTGLPNRTLFHRTLAAHLADLANDARPLSVLFLDLDRFKEVNDRLGHDVGDELLTAVSQRLEVLLRSTSMCARLGGDEFIILSPRTCTAEAGALADRIVERLGQPFRLSGHTVGVGASVGVVVTDTPMDAGELVRRGDLAMYQAKNGGRSTWCIYSPELDAGGRAEARVESELRRAVGTDQLNVDYQPVVDSPTGAVAGVEAVVRWTHPTAGIVPPAQYLAVADRAGLTEDLGAFRLAEAGAQAGRWHRASPDDTFVVTVAVGSRQLRRTGFVETFLCALADDEVLPRRILLALSDRDCADPEVRPALDALRRAGVRIALDGLGPGHTPITLLADLPIDVVRLDPQLVADLAGAPRRVAVVRALVQLAHDLGLTVTAPGVARTEDADLLRELGCDELQGECFHPPLPASVVETILHRPRRRGGAPIAS